MATVEVTLRTPWWSNIYINFAKMLHILRIKRVDVDKVAETVVRHTKVTVK